MITYKLSRREKALLLALAIVLVAIAWFVLVYQNTAGQIAHLDSQISMTETSIQVDTARVSQLESMRAVIEERKASGAKVAQVPEYDNLQALMAELNRVMGAASSYTLSFDELDREVSSEYVRRGVGISFSTESYSKAESLIKSLANGTYPCIIDSASITDNGARNGSTRTNATQGSTPVSAYAHVTFFEKYPSGKSSSTDTAEASGSAQSAQTN